MKIKTKWLRNLLLIVLCLCLLGGILLLGVNGLVCGTVRKQILSSEEAVQLPDVDCILVLGCAVWDDGTPSHMLEDRLRRGVELYNLGAAPKLLMSGDHGRTDYDEVDAMKTYAVDCGIASTDVFMDHAGFSTYESMYRAKEIFGVKKMIIVTQGYHLYRAIYIAKSLGIDAYGVAADYRQYSGQTARDLREILARVKDFGTSIFKPEPTYLGEAIPIWGNGDLTNDDNSDFT
jgi:vancomycin permeability regulator SanA